MDAYGQAIYQYAPPSPEELAKRQRLDAAMAAGTAMLAASGGRNNLGQALGAGGLAALMSRRNGQDAARDDMVAGYQMEALQRRNAQERALEQALPDLIKSGFAPEAVAGAVQRAPGAALPILDMVDKRNKAKLEAAKIETDIQDKRLKIAEKFANQAAYLAKGNPTPQQVQKFAQSLEANGVQGILGQVPFQSWANPDEAKSNLSAMASMFYDIKDRVQQEETGRHNLTTEQQTAARDAAAASDRDRTYKLSAARFGLEKTNAEAVKPQMVGNTLYFYDKYGNVKQATSDGKPVVDNSKTEKATDAQLAARGYLSRLEGANKLIAEFENKGYAPGFGAAAIYGANAIPAVGGALQAGGNALAGHFSPVTQLYRQAQEDWVRAKLRKESGAVIGAEEMDREIKTYFPQPGDTLQTRMQKSMSRKMAEDQMAIMAGIEKKSARVFATPSDGPAVGTVKNGYRFKGGDPSLESNWERV